MVDFLYSASLVDTVCLFLRAFIDLHLERHSKTPERMADAKSSCYVGAEVPTHDTGVKWRLLYQINCGVLDCITVKMSIQI